MIVIYPMLISQVVSENIVPGLIKTVESYIVANAKDLLVSDPAVMKKIQLKIKGGKFVAKESVTFSEAIEDQWKHTRTKPLTPEEKKQQEDEMWEKRNEERIKKLKDEQEKRQKELEKIKQKEKEIEQSWKERQDELETKRQKQRDEAYDDLERRKKDREKRLQQIEKKLEEYEKEKTKRKKSQTRKEKESKETNTKQKESDSKQAKHFNTTSVKITDNRALSIEPTMIDVNFTDKWGNNRYGTIGIKVIPIRVKSEVKLSHLILHDIYLKKIDVILISLGRKIIRKVWTFIDKWSARLKIGKLIPSGDPRRDIIMARSGLTRSAKSSVGGGFVVLNKLEDLDATFLSNASKINRLYKLGWGNLIIVDNVNRMAYFCFKQFKGVCTALSFSMIYYNFGSLEVYRSLEDAKIRTSSIFKVRKKFNKIVAESIVQNKLEKYLSEGIYNEKN